MAWVPVDEATEDVGGHWEPVQPTTWDRVKAAGRKVFLDPFPGTPELGEAAGEMYSRLPGFVRGAAEAFPGSPMNIARMAAEIGGRLDRGPGESTPPGTVDEGVRAGLAAAPQVLTISDVASLGTGLAAKGVTSAPGTASRLASLSRAIDMATGGANVAAGVEQFREGDPAAGLLQVGLGGLGVAGNLPGRAGAALPEVEPVAAGRKATRDAYKSALFEKGFKPEELQGMTADQLATMLRQHGVEPKSIKFERPTGEPQLADETLFNQRFEEELGRDVPNEEGLGRVELNEAKDEGRVRNLLDQAKREGEGNRALDAEILAEAREKLNAAREEGRRANAPPLDEPKPAPRSTKKGKDQHNIELDLPRELQADESLSGTRFEEGVEQAIDAPPADFEPDVVGSHRIGAIRGKTIGPTHNFVQRILDEFKSMFADDMTVFPEEVGGARMKGTRLSSDIPPTNQADITPTELRGKTPSPRLRVDPMAWIEGTQGIPQTATEYVHSLVNLLSHELGHLAPEASPHRTGLPSSEIREVDVPSVDEVQPSFRSGDTSPQEATAFSSEFSLQTRMGVIKDRLYQLPVIRKMLAVAEKPGSLVNDAFLAQMDAANLEPGSTAVSRRVYDSQWQDVPLDDLAVPAKRPVAPGGPGELPGGPQRGAGPQPGPNTPPPPAGPPQAPPGPPAPPPGGNPQLSPELKSKLTALFKLQREGRAVANNKNLVLHAKQADIIRMYDDLVKAGKLPAEQARIQQMAALDKLGKSGINEPGVGDVQLTPADIEAVQRHIRVQENHPDRFEGLRAADAAAKLMAGKQLQENELKLMRSYFGRPALGGAPTWFETWSERLAKMTGSLRALVTSLDISAPGRQGLLLTIPEPRLAASAFKAQIKSLFSEKAFKEMERTIFTNPLRAVQEASGLHLAQPGGGMRFAESMRLGGAEEIFAPSYAEKLPHVRASERAYITYLNKMRSDVFNKMAWDLRRSGINFEQQPQVYRDLAEAINTMSGRGTAQMAYISPESAIGKKLKLREEYTPGKQYLEATIPVLNTMFFSPRFMASRLAVLRDLPLLYSNYSAPVRRMMLKNVALTVGTGLSVLALAKQMGADVELDPRSSDFAKIRMGDTRLDPWAGFQPWVRFFAQMMTNERKSLKTGRVSEMGKKYGSSTRLDATFNFLTQKASPGASIVADVLRGKTVPGRPIDYTTFSNEFPYLPPDVASRLLPMVVQDIQDAVELGQEEHLALTVPASLLGIGVQTFNPRTKQPSKRIEP